MQWNDTRIGVLYKPNIAVNEAKKPKLALMVSFSKRYNKLPPLALQMRKKG